MPAVIEMESGHAVCAMGSAAEVEAALCDELLYDSDGWVLLRFAYEAACFSVDPSKVVGVYEATVREVLDYDRLAVDFDGQVDQFSAFELELASVFYAGRRNLEAA
jgi:hypothetical protein